MNHLRSARKIAHRNYGKALDAYRQSGEVFNPDPFSDEPNGPALAALLIAHSERESANRRLSAFHRNANRSAELL